MWQYTFSFFNTKSSSIYYSSFLNTLTLVFFIFSTTFTTSLSFASNFLIFSIISFSVFLINNYLFSITLISNYSSFNIIWFLLLLFTLSTQSTLLLRLSAYPILLPAIYFKAKSNLDKYKAYLVCLWFNFWAFIKYSKFLWLVHISKQLLAPSKKCLHASKYQIITNISLL